MQNNNRRKPMHGGGGRHANQNNRSRHNGGYNGNNNRPRKNYPQLREKYLNQARDALSGGDRVMAEYYFQHADHCYRMMMEEGSHRQPRFDTQADANGQAQETSAAEAQNGSMVDDQIPENTSALPSFLTMGAVPVAASTPVQDWEERDA